MQPLALPSPFENAIEQLSQQLADLAAPAQPTLVQLCTPISQQPALAWLQSQSEFPKLYWQSRDRSFESAIVGTTDSWWLTQPQADKHDWARQRQQPQLDWRYYGGHGFTPADPKVTQQGGNRLYLPKFEYRRVDEQQWLIFYLALQPKQWQAQVEQAQIALNALIEPQPLTGPTLSITQQQHTPSYERWSSLVNQLTEQLQLQQTPKVVICRETRLTTKRVANSWQLLDQWQQQQPHCYQFGIQTSPEQSFFGCSPERLFMRQQQQLFTEALAGTCRRGDSEQQSQLLANALQQDPKNIHENGLVADDIQQQLRPLTKTIQLESNAHLIALKQVSHLCRDIQAQLKPNVSESQILHALHPTAAIGGLPRQAAQAFIAEHEDVERGWYAGSFGMIGEEQSEFCVTIRSIQQDHQQLNLYAGAGIVAGSTPDAEWLELNSKLAGALAAIAAKPNQ